MPYQNDMWVAAEENEEASHTDFWEKSSRGKKGASYVGKPKEHVWNSRNGKEASG